MIKENELDVGNIDLSYTLKEVRNSYIVLHCLGSLKNCSYVTQRELMRLFEGDIKPDI